MKRARSSEVFVDGRARARRRLASLLAAATFAYLLFVSVKLAGFGGEGPVAASVGRLSTTSVGEQLQRRVEESRPRAPAGGGDVSGYGRITDEILWRHGAGRERGRWGLQGNSTKLERMATRARKEVRSCGGGAQPSQY